MADNDVKSKRIYKNKKAAATGGASSGIWFMGFIGALIYYIQFHSGNLWLVILAIIKAIVWPGILVYHLLQSLGL